MNDTPPPPNNPAAGSSSARRDAEDRRREILDQAEQLLVEPDVQFSMREVAARTGIAPSAIYQWFSGKGEILAHLFIRAFVAERDRLRAEPPASTVHTVVDGHLRAMVKFYVRTGHHRSTVIGGAGGEDTLDFIATAAAAFVGLGDALMERLNEAAEHEGVTLRDRETVMELTTTATYGAGSLLHDVAYLGMWEPSEYLRRVVDMTAGALVDPD